MHPLVCPPITSGSAPRSEELQAMSKRRSVPPTLSPLEEEALIARALKLLRGEPPKTLKPAATKSRKPVKPKADDPSTTR
jgi:hypothetical protein